MTITFQSRLQLYHPNTDQEQMTRYADLRDEISQIRKVENIDDIFIFSSQTTLLAQFVRKDLLEHISSFIRSFTGPFTRPEETTSGHTK